MGWWFVYLRKSLDPLRPASYNPKKTPFFSRVVSLHVGLRSCISKRPGQVQSQKQALKKRLLCQFMIVKRYRYCWCFRNQLFFCCMPGAWPKFPSTASHDISWIFPPHRESFFGKCKLGKPSTVSGEHIDFIKRHKKCSEGSMAKSTKLVLSVRLPSFYTLANQHGNETCTIWRCISWSEMSRIPLLR